ncbi:hypothetical protein FPOA_08316 [Fusarium poae]|uniref:Uncharacterized protein n=1 Tax=Fusarium poae TaxID=36050 RepID=A0A1B8AN38_FUSPO|nr:hypothetical protein FPOA_08316 [Fusarium poae]
MAQEISVQGTLVSRNVLSGLADDQRYQIEQYEKIVHLRDAILSGQHPTIKPSNIHTSANSPSTRPIDTSSSHGVSNNQSDKQHQVGISTPASSSTAKNSKPSGAGFTEINPIFLEKSEDLVKAELRLQRQKLERALKDEVDQKKATTKSAAQGEPIVEFDLNQVLSEALTRVQSTTGPDTTVPAADTDNASDSFDDNTFYSSQHNTPSSVLTSRIRNESEDAQVPASEPRPPINYHSNAILKNRPTDAEQIHPDMRSQPQNQQAYSNPANFAGSFGFDSVTRPGQVPGLTTYNEDRAGLGQDASARQSPSNLDIDRHRGDYGSAIQQPAREQHIDSRPASPLRRINARSSPDAHASPLANARRRPLALQATSTSSTGTPAQIAVLRNEPIAVTSPESSPQGGQASEKEKRKAKKKKRKADRQAPDAEPTPYIKTEPRSPSPLNAPSYIRPNKRQRYTQQQPDEPGYEEIRYEPRPTQYLPEPSHSRQERDDRMPISYERVDFPSQRATSTAIPGGTVYRREFADDRYVQGGSYAVEQSPLISAHHQRQSVGGTAGPQVRPHDTYQQRPSWPYLGHEASPSALRGEGDVFMAPHRPPPTRIIVDAYGREYIEPPRPTIIRQSAAPHARSGEPEIIYERAPPRRPLGTETYDEGGAVYRRRSPSYMPRRVVTQPEYISRDYRDQRLHEQPSRPLGHPGEFVEVMAPPERRRLEDGTREYITRPSSVRPAEPVRYEVARDYGRVQSVRPEVPVRQYAPSVHPENCREAAQPYGREYGALTAEQGVVRQEYSTRPVERYYNQSMRGGEEIAFIEQPRGETQEIVYADDARREVYR